jgi:hypothetical protein
MKQLKAIEILKECKSYAELWSVEPLSKGEQSWIYDIDEAIAELEALQEPKLCDECEYYISGEHPICIRAFGCARNPHNYPDRYKPKEQ